MRRASAISAFLLALTLIGIEQLFPDNGGWASAEARTQRASAHRATRASTRRGSSTRRSTSARRRATSSVRRISRGGIRSKRTLVSSRRQTSRRTSRVSARRGRVVRAAPVIVHDSPEKVHFRSLLTRAYSLRDEALNEKMAGNFGVALEKLKESVSVFEEHGGSESNAVKALLYYDIGQTAEMAGDLSLARDSYQRCLRVATPLTSHEASLRLAMVLARAGNLNFALRVGEEAAQTKPNDPRLRVVLAMINDVMGNTNESDRQRDLLRSQFAGISVPRLPARMIPSSVGAPEGSASGSSSKNGTSSTQGPSEPPSATTSSSKESDTKTGTSKTETSQSTTGERATEEDDGKTETKDQNGKP